MCGIHVTSSLIVSGISCAGCFFWEGVGEGVSTDDDFALAADLGVRGNASFSIAQKKCITTV